MLYDKGAVSDAERIKEWLAAALSEGESSGRTAAALAAHCGVTRQAVNGWLSTGRITKSNLAMATAFFGHGPSFGMQPSHTARERGMPAWPFERIEPRRYAALGIAERRLIEAYAQGIIDAAQANNGKRLSA